MALLFWLSSRPRLPAVGPDSSSHFLAYAVLAALLVRALAGGLGSIPGRAAAMAFLISSLYGVTDEIHQRFVPGRQASARDVLADAAGSAVAAAAAWSRGRRRPAPALETGE